MAHRFKEGLTRSGKFNGFINIHPDRLDIPLKRKKKTVWALWNELHHELVPMSFREDAYAVMHGCDRHIYLILTKRPGEMLRYFQLNTLPTYAGRDHIYHGLTVCNQAEADEKILIFLRVPGKKFLSIEPMLGAINLGHWESITGENHGLDSRPKDLWIDSLFRGIDAIILGGETGSCARPVHPDWVRSVRDQCAAAGVPFFFKGWGEWVHDSLFTKETEIPKDYKIHGMVDGGNYIRIKNSGRLLDGRTHDDLIWNTPPH
jgi:protein gp37